MLLIFLLHLLIFQFLVFYIINLKQIMKVYHLFIMIIYKLILIFLHEAKNIYLKYITLYSFGLGKLSGLNNYPN